MTATPIGVPAENIQKLKDNLLLYYTGLTRVSSEILSEQKRGISDKTKVLDQMLEMVDTAVEGLRCGEAERWGILLDEAWNLKKSLASKISNSEINQMYDRAKEAGAVGGKILGAGGGGFLLLYVPQKKRALVMDALKDYKKVEFDFENMGSRIIFMEEHRR